MFVGKRGRRRVALAHAHIHAHHRTAEGKSLRPEYHGTQLRHVTVTLT
jgi:hypothetical protein